MDWIAGLPTTGGGLYMIQNHVDLLSGRCTRSPHVRQTAAQAAGAAEMMREVCMCSDDGFPDVPVLDHGPKFTSDVSRAFFKNMASTLIVGSAYHKNTNAKVERANGVIGDKLRDYANARKDDLDRYQPLAVFAINNAASTLATGSRPSSSTGACIPACHSPPRPPTQGATPASNARRMRELSLSLRQLLAAAKLERKAKLDPGQVDTVFKVGNLVLLRTQELLDATSASCGCCGACPSPNAYTLALPPRMQCSPTVNVDRLKPFYARVSAPPAPVPVSDAGQDGEHEAELLLNLKTSMRGVTRYLVWWREHTSADVAAGGGAAALPGGDGPVPCRCPTPPGRASRRPACRCSGGSRSVGRRAHPSGRPSRIPTGEVG